MDYSEVIKTAISLKKPITYQYKKEGKAEGIRIGNPHALFYHNTTQRLTVDIYQTDGICDEDDKMPGWRTILAEHLDDVKVLEDKEEFALQEGYDRYSERYFSCIAEV